MQGAWSAAARPGDLLQRPGGDPAPSHHRGTRQRQPQPQRRLRYARRLPLTSLY